MKSENQYKDSVLFFLIAALGIFALMLILTFIN